MPGDVVSTPIANHNSPAPHSNVSDDEDATENETRSPVAVNGLDLFSQKFNPYGVLELNADQERFQREAILEAQRRILALQGGQPGQVAGFPFFAGLPVGHPLVSAASLFPVQTEPLSLKMDGGNRRDSDNQPQPPSGSGSSEANHAGHVSPSTSSTSLNDANDALGFINGLNQLSPKDSDGEGSQTGTGQQHSWSYEEQFKQLYELDEDTKRKEFLDELFSFMQKRGSPVTRIPIMAKQVLDLFQLYRLVVDNGGLVEVINKKLWREITKGLNLPSSITSAAFTLRTQYMKYLYPYECEKEQLSTPSELQAAIDGNRREGRRGSFPSPYGAAPPSMIAPQRHNGLNGGILPDGADLFAAAAAASNPATSLAAQQALLQAAAYREQALCLEAAQRQIRSQNAFRNASMENNNKLPKHESRSRRSSVSSQSSDLTAPQINSLKRRQDDPESIVPSKMPVLNNIANSATNGTPAQQTPTNLFNLPSANLKITSRGDGRSSIDSSLLVSMELNGVLYQGVLFAQANASGGASKTE